MKKLLAFVLIAAMMISVFLSFGVTVNAAYPDASVMKGYENLCLTYTWNPSRTDNGRHTESDLLPYVAYCDRNGNIKDFFFDSYLFLPCVKLGASGGSMHYDSSKPTKAIDWTSYIDDLFYTNANVNALNSAVGTAKAALDSPQKKVGVFFTILYPGKASGANFGTLGGRAVDMSKLEDRKYAVKWMIDEQLSRYKNAGYENLDLVGFYWLEEYILSGTNGEEDKQVIKYASDYLHSLGLKFLWVPYYHANGYTNWQSLGFDIASMQPNMYWDLGAGGERVISSAEESQKLGMGVEIEVDNLALTNGVYYNRYLDYLRGGMVSGAMEGIKIYYQGGKDAVYYSSCHASGPRARSIYDLTYKYAKGTLTQTDIDKNKTEVFALPQGVEWISRGKTYEATAAYQGSGSAGYLDNDGKELTDGEIWGAYLGTEWHAFHVSNLDSENRMSVTIDLGWVRGDLTNFLAIFSHANEYGIGDPADDVKIYISLDGNSFKLLAQPKLEISDIIAYVNYETSAVSARYVKFSFTNSDANFVFCSEVLVGTKNGGGSDILSGKMNVARGKSYTADGIYVSNGSALYPDEDGITLTDGKYPVEAYYADKAFVGFNRGSSYVAANGYASILLDLGRSFPLDAFSVSAGSKKLSNGIAAPYGIEVYVSSNKRTWTYVGAAEYSDSIVINSVDAMLTLDDPVDARYVQYRVIPQADTSVSWMFLCEVMAYSDDFNGSLADIDASGEINSVDYLIAKRACFGSYTFIGDEKLRADVNIDAIVDSLDYVIIKRMAFGTY